MSKEVLDILNRIGLERNIPVDTLFEALESALISASRKMLPAEMDVVEAELDRETGEFRVYANMEVVEEVEDENYEISLEEAREYVDDVQPGENLVIDVTPEDFGRIAAQSAKQVITQRIREAEREVIYDKYKNRTGDLVVGTVQRYEKGNVIVDLGNAEAVMPSSEQPTGERYRYGDRVKATIKEIRKSTKDAQIILSRKTPELVLKLFEQEVAEIRDGVVSIRLIAREAGKRSKIAVLSSDNDVDPVGACVGMKGSRVQMVVQELRGERIDIIEYSDDKRRFVANSLKPANIESVELDVENNRALLVVRDEELALAIGKAGLNAKLATELTDVEIDIISESELHKREAEAKTELLKVPSIKDQYVDALLGQGIIKFDDILNAGETGLAKIEGLDQKTAKIIISETEQLVKMRDRGEELLLKKTTEAESSEAEAQDAEPQESASHSEPLVREMNKEGDSPELAPASATDDPLAEAGQEPRFDDTIEEKPADFDHVDDEPPSNEETRQEEETAEDQVAEDQKKDEHPGVANASGEVESEEDAEAKKAERQTEETLDSASEDTPSSQTDNEETAEKTALTE